MHLTFPGVASMFVKMRRVSSQARSSLSGAHRQTSSSSEAPNSPNSPPPSPGGSSRILLVSSSGDSPLNHPQYVDPNSVSLRKVAMSQKDVYTCVGGVNVDLLLRASRMDLYQQAESIGANVLVDEMWKCTISKKGTKALSPYKVIISYSASASRSAIPDPHKPVALENAKGVPGLMTIIRRND
ncbi:hypothetical protein ONZ45_g14158 [Pleurotus djamor]|nr:hypothetical protein ONZ45_g14158 [Pleurotus djamor]